ncbi:MAG: hypothetical protein E7018_02075 [Alphaproteobacteria bacterium]|nr:hypothetical protein [Alphaproteobacteria bacterium]
MRKNILIYALLLLSGCSSSWNEGGMGCPNVIIPGEKAYLTRADNRGENFRIELVGYEGYCYVEPNLPRHYAVITPQFRLHRLSDIDETRVDFSFHTETLQGPPGFLGKRTYFANGQIDANQKYVDFSGRPVKVKIPMDDDDFEIMLGLEMSSHEYEYNKSTFDTRNYKASQSSDSEQSCAAQTSSSCGCNK